MKMLITDLWEMTDQERAWLEGKGLELVEGPDEEFQGDPSDIDIVACRMLFSHVPIEKFRSLKYLQIFFAGFDHLPMDYIKAHNIEFHNARDVYSIPIAEFGIGGVLSLYKQFRDFDREQKERAWNPRRSLGELYGKTVLIVGAGSIGAAFAERFRAFHCRMVGLARTAGERPFFDEVHAMDKLDELLPAADVVVLALPNNDQTQHIMNADRFAKMKPGAVLVNICRGAVVDEPALVKALQSGHLGGAVLDVFQTEPLPAESPLWAMENVIVAPHTSFGGEYNRERRMEVLMRNLENSPLLKKG